mgnify:FL=1
MSDNKVIRHPSTDMGRARDFAREGSFAGKAKAVLTLSDPDTVAYAAMTEILRSPKQMTEDEQVNRAADFMVGMFQNESWAAIIEHAKENIGLNSNPDFAEKVYAEILRRHNEGAKR